MSTSRITPEKWMWTDGNGEITTAQIVKLAAGWTKIHQNGQEELIHALVTLGDVAPTTDSITDHADGIYPAATAFSMTVTFSEAITVITTGGTPSLVVYTDVGDQYVLEYASGTGTVSLVFTGTPAGIEGGSLVIVEQIALLDGTLQDSAGNDVDVRFPSDYTQPAIEITDVSSVTNHADATYTDAIPLTFTVVYSEAMDVDEVGGTPSIQIWTEIANKFDLAYASGTGTASLVFTGTPTGIANGSLVVGEDVILNAGTIKNAATSDAVSTFPTAYVQPTITMTTP